MSVADHIRSQLDPVKPYMVEGWVFSTSAPLEHIAVDLFVNDEHVETLSTSVFRKGLFERNLHPDGTCGFRFELKNGIANGDKVSVRISESQSEIDGSPIIFEEEPNQRPFKRIFFMHIAKTGGTTINEWMMSHFGASRVRPHMEGSALFSEPHLLEEYDFVSGHVRAQRFDQLEGSNDFLKVTLLREPLGHLASHLAWVKHVGQDPSSRFFKSHSDSVKQLAISVQEVDFSKSKELEQFLNEANKEALNLFDNCQLRYFLSGQVSERIGFEHLVEAMTVLNSMHLVGCVERMDDFMSDLASISGLSISPKNETKNKHSDRYGLSLESPGTVKALLPYVLYDMVLYNKIRKNNHRVATF